MHLIFHQLSLLRNVTDIYSAFSENILVEFGMPKIRLETQHSEDHVKHITALMPPWIKNSLAMQNLSVATTTTPQTTQARFECPQVIPERLKEGRTKKSKDVVNEIIVTDSSVYVTIDKGSTDFHKSIDKGHAEMDLQVSQSKPTSQKQDKTKRDDLNRSDLKTIKISRDKLTAEQKLERKILSDVQQTTNETQTTRDIMKMLETDVVKLNEKIKDDRRKTRRKLAKDSKIHFAKEFSEGLTTGCQEEYTLDKSLKPKDYVDNPVFVLKKKAMLPPEKIAVVDIKNKNTRKKEYSQTHRPKYSEQFQFGSPVESFCSSSSKLRNSDGDLAHPDTNYLCVNTLIGPEIRPNPFKVKLEDVLQYPTKSFVKNLSDLRADLGRCLRTIETHIDISGLRIHSLILEDTQKGTKNKVVVDLSKRMTADAEPHISYISESEQAEQESQTVILAMNESKAWLCDNKETKSMQAQVEMKNMAVQTDEEVPNHKRELMLRENDDRWIWDGTEIGHGVDLKKIVKTYVLEQMEINRTVPVKRESNDIEDTTPNKVSAEIISDGRDDDDDDDNNQDHEDRETQSVVRNKTNNFRKLDVYFPRKHFRKQSHRRRTKGDHNESSSRRLPGGRRGTIWKDIEELVKFKLGKDDRMKEVRLEIEDNSVHEDDQGEEVVAKGNYKEGDCNMAIEVDLTMTDLETILSQKKRKWQQSAQKPSVRLMAHSLTTDVNKLTQ